MPNPNPSSHYEKNSHYDVETKAIVFDFDGVILESVDVKTKAFALLFEDYPDQLPAIIDLYKKHGGMSRFEKFKIIYKDILKEPLTEEKKESLGKQFSDSAYQEVLSSPLVKGAKEFLQAHHKEFYLFVASGTPDTEIKSIIKDLDLDGYFKEVFGSPSKKKDIILEIMDKFGFKNSEVIMVGDSINDEEGAKAAGVSFVWRTKDNNPFRELEKLINRKK